MDALHSNLPLGVVLGEPAETYHAANGVTNHRLADLQPHPILFYRRHVSREIPPAPQTDAFLFGEYVHTLAQEGEAVADERYVLIPGDAPKYPTPAQWNAKKPSEETMAACAWWKNFNEANKGKKQIDRESYDLAWRMVAAIRANKSAVQLYSRGRAEVVLRKRMENFTIQSRLDWLDDTLDDYGRPTITDLKTIDHLAEFPKQFIKYGYYRQVGFYQLVAMEAMNLPGAFPKFRFVVVEKNEPFQCQVFEPDELACHRGRTDVMRDLKLLNECCVSGVWPGAPDDITPLALPKWME